MNLYRVQPTSAMSYIWALVKVWKYWKIYLLACIGSPFLEVLLQEESVSLNLDLFTNPVLLINIRHSWKVHHINLLASQDLCHSTIDKSTRRSWTPLGTINSPPLRRLRPPQLRLRTDMANGVHPPKPPPSISMCQAHRYLHHYHLTIPHSPIQDYLQVPTKVLMQAPLQVQALMRRLHITGILNWALGILDDTSDLSMLHSPYLHTKGPCPVRCPWAVSNAMNCKVYVSYWRCIKIVGSL